MSKWKRHLKKLPVIILIFVLVVWLNNSSILATRENKNVQLLAHRGLAQTFNLENVAWNTNTAEIINEPEHPYLENTLESMKAAFDLGADIVEFDVRKTKDNKLAVFHDYDLSYRTDLEGEVSDFTMKELKNANLGYGYTADNGISHPFREKFVGAMPEAQEVFDAFPDKELLVDIKDSDLETARILDKYFQQMGSEQRSKISMYGGKEAVEYLHQRYPEMKHLYRKKLEQGLIKYILFGWTGYIPQELHSLHLHIPARYTFLLWGWPNKFLNRMDDVGTRVVVVGGDGKWSDGIDSKNDLELLPKNFTGTIWTERVDVLSALLKEDHLNKYSARCAVLSSIDTGQKCTSCLENGDFWIAPAGCVSKFDDRAVCGSSTTFDSAKTCIECIEANNSWQNAECLTNE